MTSALDPVDGSVPWSKEVVSWLLNKLGILRYDPGFGSGLGKTSLQGQIFQLLDQYVAPGSQVRVVADLPAEEVDVSEAILTLHNQTVRYQHGDPTDRDVLDGLDLTQNESA